MGTLLGDRESLNLGSRGPGLGDRGPELIRERSASREGDGDLGLLSTTGTQLRRLDR